MRVVGGEVLVEANGERILGIARVMAQDTAALAQLHGVDEHLLSLQEAIGDLLDEIKHRNYGWMS